MTRSIDPLRRAQYSRIGERARPAWRSRATRSAGRLLRAFVDGVAGGTMEREASSQVHPLCRALRRACTDVAQGHSDLSAVGSLPVRQYLVVNVAAADVRTALTSLVRRSAYCEARLFTPSAGGLTSERAGHMLVWVSAVCASPGYQV